MPVGISLHRSAAARRCRRDIVDLRTKLDAATTAIERDPTSAQQAPTGWFYSGDDASGRDGKLAFLFPGQGSQYVGMSGDLALAFATSRTIWDEAADLEFEQGGQLHEVVFPQPVFSDEDRVAQEERLRATEWAQPAIGVASLSLLVLLKKLGIQPDAVGGHSFGEVTALHTAGALDRKAFFSVARKRGELMAEAAAMFPGAMTAISHAADAVASLLASWNTGVVIANHNSPESGRHFWYRERHSGDRRKITTGCDSLPAIAGLDRVSFVGRASGRGALPCVSGSRQRPQTADAGLRQQHGSRLLQCAGRHP
jgi:hypothetical protein